jgi:hypothetical protein
LNLPFNRCRTIAEQAHTILITANPYRKASLTQNFYQQLHQKQREAKSDEIELGLETQFPIPLHPARPDQPKLGTFEFEDLNSFFMHEQEMNIKLTFILLLSVVSPRAMPNHKTLNVPLSVYLLHSLARIHPFTSTIILFKFKFLKHYNLRLFRMY